MICRDIAIPLSYSRFKARKSLKHNAIFEELSQNSLVALVFMALFTFQKVTFSPSMFEALHDTPLEKVRTYNIQKLINSLKLWKVCGTDGIPNECLRYLPRRPLIRLTHLFIHCLQLSHSLNSWMDAKIITLPKLGKDHNFPQHLRPVSLFYATDELFEKVILKIIQSH
jgi:hypothetical protein